MKYDSLLSIPLGVAFGTYRFFALSGKDILGWDTANFLNNGAIFAGFYRYGYDTTRPPVLPVILSLIFRVGNPSTYAIFFLSVVLYGVLASGFYLIARELLHPIIALGATISYLTIVNVVYWSGVGYTHVESLAIGSLGFATLIFASKNHSRTYPIAFALLGLSILTRYSLVTLFAAAIVYLLSGVETLTKREFKHLFAGLILAPILLVPFMFQWFTSASSYKQLFPAPHNDLPYTFDYFLRLPTMLGNGVYGYIILFFFLVSIAFLAHDIWTARKHPIILALFLWFVVLIGYYSVEQSSTSVTNELRYSIEFAFPAVILSFWALSRLGRTLSGIYPNHSKLIGSLLCIMLIPFAFISMNSGLTVSSTPSLLTQPQELGATELVGWLNSNIPSGTTITSDANTVLQWYAPAYKFVYFGDYPLSSNATFSKLVLRLNPSVSFLVWSSQAPWHNTHLHLVWHASNKTMYVYKIAS